MNEGPEGLSIKQIVESMKLVIDPELGVNIIDLGLIYNIKIEQGNKIRITMTLTTPGCPLSDYFISEIETVLMDIEKVEDVFVDFTWNPSWDLSMMDEEAKQSMFNGFRR